MLRATDATFPVLCVQSVGNSTQQDVDEVHKVYLRAFQRPGRLLCISDARRANHDAKQRKLLADWSNEITRLGKDRVAVTIVLLDSAVLRGALTALNWLTPPVIPQRIVGDVSTALEEAHYVTRNEGLVVQDDLWGQVRHWIERNDAEVAR